MIQISRQGRVVTVLKGIQADRFLTRVQDLNETEAQLLMAKATGQYKIGNERNKP